MMREHLKQGNKRLPLIANLVLYSGKKTPYPYSVNIYDCFEAPGKAREMMFKPLKLIDLGQMSEEELLQHGSADFLELLLKQGRERTFYRWLEEHPEFFKALLKRVYGKSGIVYILSEEDEYSGTEIVDKLKAIAPSKKEEIMTAAQTLIKEGEAIGIRRNKEEMAERMLLKGMDVLLIEDVTGLSTQEIMQLSDKLGISNN